MNIIIVLISITFIKMLRKILKYILVSNLLEITLPSNAIKITDYI